jgi:hypothetical protein
MLFLFWATENNPKKPPRMEAFAASFHGRKTAVDNKRIHLVASRKDRDVEDVLEAPDE